MHAGNLESSKMLQSIYEVLLDCQPHSTREIADKTGCVAVGTRISELRNGLQRKRILCSYKGRTDTGNRIYEYQLLPF